MNNEERKERNKEAQARYKKKKNGLSYAQNQLRFWEKRIDEIQFKLSLEEDLETTVGAIAESVPMSTILAEIIKEECE